MQREHRLPSCLFSFPKAVSNSLIYRAFFPKGSGEMLQDEESLEKFSGLAGPMPRLYLGWDFCPLRQKWQGSRKYARIRPDRLQLDKMSEAYHCSSARTPGISG